MWKLWNDENIQSQSESLRLAGCLYKENKKNEECWEESGEVGGGSAVETQRVSTAKELIDTARCAARQTTDGQTTPSLMATAQCCGTGAMWWVPYF